MRFSIDAESLNDLLSTQRIIGSPDGTHPGYLLMGLTALDEKRIVSWAMNGTASVRVVREAISVQQTGSIGIPILHAEMLMSVLKSSKDACVSVVCDETSGKIKFSCNGNIYKASTSKIKDVPEFVAPAGVTWKAIEEKTLSKVSESLSRHVSKDDDGLAVFSGINLSKGYSQATDRHSLVRVHVGIGDGDVVVLPGALSVPFQVPAEKPIVAVASDGGAFWLRARGVIVRSSTIVGEFPNAQIDAMLNRDGMPAVRVDASAFSAACSRISSICRDDMGISKVGFKFMSNGDAYMVSRSVDGSGVDAAELVRFMGLTDGVKSTLSSMSVNASLLGTAMSSIRRASRSPEVSLYSSGPLERMVIEGDGASGLVMPMSG